MTRSVACLLLFVTMQAQAPAPRTIEIWSELPISVDIEWLTIEAGDKLASAGKRRASVGPPIPIEVTPGADRYIRFSYPGASPRTYSADELLTKQKLHVPDLMVGGELLLIVPQARVRPIRLEIDGPRREVRELSASAHTALAGFPAGAYKVTPVYQGGAKGKPQAFVVRDAESTLGVLPTEQVGAVHVKAGSLEVCRAAAAFIMTRGSAGGRRTVVRIPHPECVIDVAGLKPGNYEAGYDAVNAPRGTIALNVLPQNIAIGTTPAPPVSVSGRVTLNGRGMAGAQVDFSRTDNPTREALNSVTAHVNHTGYYSALLHEAGTYAVRVRDGRGSMQLKPLVISVGRHTHDFAFRGAVVDVALSGWDGRSVIHVRLHSGSDVNVTTWNARREPTGPQVRGLPFGQHEVSIAINGRQFPWLVKTVETTEGQPQVRVSFDLNRRQ